MAIKLNARETELKNGKKPNPSLKEGFGLGLRERAPFLVTLYRHSVITKQGR